MQKLFIFTLSIMLMGLAATSSASNSDTQYITIKGSDTMVHLVSTWAEEYMNTNKGAEVSVTGGGSGTGFAALLNGTTEICAASRGIKDKETQLASTKGIQPTEYVVARDGIAVVVNPANPVTELTLAQLKGIYTGTITNWSEVGGPSQPIVVLSRENSSGTYVFFQEKVLEEEDYSANALLMPATGAIVNAVSSDKWAIGYVGLGYADNAKDQVKVLGIKSTSTAKTVYPSEATVTDGSYEIARPLYLYVNGMPQGLTKSFIDFSKSSQGQKIVKETGYVPVG